MKFDDPPSSITSASLALLSRQIVHLPWWKMNCTLLNGVGNVLSSFSTGVNITRTTSSPASATE